MSILVVGSFMMDLVTKTQVAPKPGETVVGISFQTFLGGKGANQAIAAKRLGSEVIMAGMVGMDDFGSQFLDFFQHEENMNVDYILRSRTSTGIGSITLDGTGQNKIVVVPGANLEYRVSDLAQLESVFPTVSTVMCQLEMRMDVITAVAKMAKAYGKRFILNPAPFQTLSDELLGAVDILTPNESELSGILGIEKLDTLQAKMEAAKTLLEKGVKTVIVTLGDQGALLVSQTRVETYPAYKVDVVDTVAAGDSFNGALAAKLDQGQPLEAAILFANAVGALAVQKAGAIPSLPTTAAVAAFLKNNRL